jgi:hypothetical protein
LLSNAQYEVEFEDGTTDKFFANVIAENLFAQCDSEGRVTFAMKEITNHRFNNKALSSEDAYYVDNRNGEKKMKPTTQGAEIEIEWNDGTSDWMPMKEVKASFPIELAEYAVANKIADMPQYRWWVPHTLKKRNRIISKVKTKYWRTTHKFGIKLPKSVKEAFAIDAENGNTLWRDALRKEMLRVKVAMLKDEQYTPDQIRSNNAPEYRSFTEITAHVIFDVKMNFDRKCRFVANGSHTDIPQAVTYSCVVDRDSVRLAFLIAAINGLEISSCDIGNAYLNAPCREKIWFEAGPELREDEGCVMRITRALYGLRSSGAAWRSMFSNFIINQLGFEPMVVDSDVYRRKNHKQTGEAYYELLLCYVDDVLLISHAPSAVMKEIQNEFRLKDDSYGPPKTYLGAEIEEFTIREEGKPDVKAWSFMSEKYVKNAKETVEGMLREEGRELKTNWLARRHRGPLPHTYKPELDTTELCDDEHASRYRQIIGILRWAVELGRIDILTPVALLSQYQAAPRTAHLEALYMIIFYLKKNPKKRLVFDPSIPEVDWEEALKEVDWTEFYGDITEEDPKGMPEPLGNPVRTSCFVDADHAGNKITRRSHTGIFLFVNGAMIQAFSKKQNTVESATFGSELVALRIARDMIKLKMFGVPIEGPTLVFCDNNGVVMNTSIPTSTLNKKHNSINYHIIRESAAAGILRVIKEDTKTNIADVLTKLLPYDRAEELLSFHYDY